MTTEVATFNYKQLDEPTAEFLLIKERNMREIVGKAYTDLGRELKEAQDELSRHGFGCFEEWYTSMGFKKRNVYRIIERYDLVRANLAQSDIIEDLPVSLTYEIAAPSAESTEPKRQAKAAVLDGEVKTLKEYRELVAKLEAAEARADKAEADYDELRETLEDVYEQPKQVEYVRDDADSEQLRRYKERFGDIETYESNTFRVPNSTDISASIQTFGFEARALLKKYAYLTQYTRELSVIPAAVSEDYESTLEALSRFVMTLRDDADSAKHGTTIINVN